MFIKISNFYCICVTPFQNGNHSKVPTGALLYDFAKDAVLVGREIIGLEGVGSSVEADHWNKGPHHFWVAVAGDYQHAVSLKSLRLVQCFCVELIW
jgi:hypothetical protein